MSKLYPIVKKAKTMCGYKLSDDYNGPRQTLYYCPVCNRRLSCHRVDCNDTLVVLHNRQLKPIYCQGCGSLIHPLPRKE